MKRKTIQNLFLPKEGYNNFFDQLSNKLSKSNNLSQTVN